MKNQNQTPAKNFNATPHWAKQTVDTNVVNQDQRAITAKQLRDELFEVVTAATGGEEIRCHTVKEFRYGEIVSTSSVTGLKVVTDDLGIKHLIITTN